MKKLFLFLLIFWAVVQLQSQKLEYRLIKDKYDIKDYSNGLTPKIYSPLTAGILSYLLPGGGHYYLNEGERGVLFTLTSLTGYIIAIKGFVYFLQGEENFENYIVLGSAISLGSMIWSIIDAVHVAKIKNLAYEDLKNNTTSLNIQPVLISQQDVKGLGLKLAITF